MKTPLLAAGAFALAVSAASAQDYAFNWTPAGTVTPTPPAGQFLALAGAGDLYEMESSRLVLETTSDPDVRRFAQMMIEHHAKTSQDAAKAARTAGLEPAPPMLDAPKAAMIAALEGYDGVERDRLYLTQQHTAHKEALGLQKTYAESGDTPQLRAAARTTASIIETHLAQLDRLMR